jgi:hypothetical protein
MPLHAAHWGVAIHARIGQHLSKEIGPVGLLAHDLLALIPATLQRLGPSLKGNASGDLNSSQ